LFVIGQGFCSLRSYNLNFFTFLTNFRYYFELEEYKRRKANEEQHAEQQKGWSTTTDQVIDVPLKNLSVVQQGQPPPV